MRLWMMQNRVASRKRSSSFIIYIVGNEDYRIFEIGVKDRCRLEEFGKRDGQ